MPETKKKSATEELIDKLEKASGDDEATEIFKKAMLKEKVAPPINDTITKAKNAIALAKKIKQKQINSWYCSECGGHNIQLYLNGEGNHFSVHLEDDEPTGYDGEPLSVNQTATMIKARAKTGR